MIIGDWSIDDAGMIKHLQCSGEIGSWSRRHRCWIDYGYKDITGRAAGSYEQILVPEFVWLISKNQCEIWLTGKKAYYGKT